MADDTQKDDVNRVTPRDVQPDRERDGASRQDHADGTTSATPRRPLDTTVEADGGDQAGVAGGAIDGNVSGRGSDRR